MKRTFLAIDALVFSILVVNQRSRHKYDTYFFALAFINAKFNFIKYIQILVHTLSKRDS